MSSDGVVLLHGIARTSASMRPMQHALEAEGFTVLNLDYRSRHLPLAAALVLPGPSDGTVTVASTRLASMADHRVVRKSHTRLIAHPEAIRATIAFLRHGTFR